MPNQCKNSWKTKKLPPLGSRFEKQPPSHAAFGFHKNFKPCLSELKEPLFADINRTQDLLIFPKLLTVNRNVTAPIEIGNLLHVDTW